MVKKQIKKGEGFKFTGRFLAEAKRNIKKYPKDRPQSAVLSLLFLAQEQNHENGHYVSEAAMHEIAGMLDMPYIRVMEVASFFTMINLKPVGQYHIQLCGTTPCMLCGAKNIRTAIENYLNIKCGETTKDGLFTLTEVECLGACSNAPMVQINDDYFEDLTEDTMVAILKRLEKGEKITAGSQIGRKCSEPHGGPQTLLGMM